MAARLMGYVSASNTPTVVAPTAYGVATGGIGAAQSTGTLADGFTYNYLTFNATGTLTVTKAGFFDYCLVGGGGGTLYIAGHYATGGGGAGQILIGSIYLSSNQTITIGAGGSYFQSVSGNISIGGVTSIDASSPFKVAALGNLATDKVNQTGEPAAYVGGQVGTPGTPATTQTENIYIGYRSGQGSLNGGGSGGGGSTARGGDAPSNNTGGVGGAGFDVSAFIGGSELRKAMGGSGGGSSTGGAAATGGVAGTATTTPNNGNANSGGGSGGGNGVVTQGNGGSGICYIRFR